MDKKKKIYIYAIYFPTSDKYYIGQTYSLKDRMFRHLRADSLVGRALRKHDDWQISVLHIAQSRDIASTLEIEEIRNFNSVSPNGYNLTHGGEGGVQSEETRNKMSVAHTGKHLPKDTINKISASKEGKHHSKDTINKISVAHIGKHHSKDTINKISAAKIGKQFTDEQKLIIRYKKLKTRLRNLENEIESAGDA